MGKMIEDEVGGVAVVHCDCYVHKSTRFVNKIVENAAARRSSLCPLLGLSPLMAPPVRPRVGSGEHKVRHRRIEDEKVFEELYKFGNKLGQGSFGVVIEAENLETKERWAIKKVNKEKAGSSAITLLEREVTILKRVKHEHIIFVEEVFETSRKMYLVMELCELGEMRSLLFTNSPFSEISARHIIKSLTDAIVYLHKNGIVHRDLKLENILIAGCRTSSDVEEEHPLYDIKLTDFGMSVVKGGVGSESMLQSSCGTPIYMDSSRSDSESRLLTTEDKLFELIKRAELDFSKPVWKNISKAAKNLISQLLDVNPARRLTATEVMSHPWTLGSLDATAPNPTNVLDLMKDYAKEMKDCANNGENDPDENSDLFGKDTAATDDEDKRPESSDSQPSRSSESASKHKKSAKSAPPSNATNHIAHRMAPVVQSANTDNARRGSLPAIHKNSPTKKPMSTPRKIYDNKTMAKQSSSPVGVNPGPSRVNRSPVQGVGPSRENRSNGHRLTPATDHGLHHGHSHHLHSRPKQETNSGAACCPPIGPQLPGAWTMSTITADTLGRPFRLRC
ncbi:unnamed protein product [Clavelina lepadiformis]|uniref:Protein kinase domain-containing protein n=1 Tax=Clavelina lepadiformis TaxID=159417 RepID=A0ABP0FWM3_CLALP